MMTLDEAIKHAEEVANREREDWVYCIKCAEEHKQLVGWLKELKTYKEQKPKTGHWINCDPICPCCGEDKFKDLDADIWSDWKPKYCPNCGAKMESERKAET